MKVIFLDFDGVLNYERYVRASKGFGLIIDPERMKLLKQITDKTGAVVVLSTSWREHWSENAENCDEIGHQIIDLFSEYDIKIISKTTEERMPREQQIRLWLHNHPEIEDFAVIDDLTLEDPVLEGHLVKTHNGRKGLDEESVKQAIEILLGGAR